MSNLGERLTKVAVTPTGSAIQKRQNIAAELQSISALVEEKTVHGSYDLRRTTTAMILAEENVVLAKATAELSARMQELNGRQRKQTEVLVGLLTATDFGLPSTVLNDALPSEQGLLELLDLPGTYSRQSESFENPSRTTREN
jgi:hypothetical protein